MAPLPAELFNCTWVSETLCPVTEDSHYAIIQGGMDIRTAFNAAYPNMYPVKKWPGPLEATCCMDSYMRSIMQPTLTMSARQLKRAPQLVVLAEVVTHAAYKPLYIAWNTSTRFVFDTTNWKFTSMIQENSNPYIQGEQFIAPNKTLSLARYEMVIERNPKWAQRPQFSAFTFTHLDRGVSEYHYFKVNDTPEFGYPTPSCHHEIHWNPINRTFFTVCSEGNATVYEFDLAGNQLWSFWHPKMHIKPFEPDHLTVSHVNSVSYDPEADEVVVNELLFGGVFGISRSESKLKWCVGNGDLCSGRYNASRLVGGERLTFHMHQVHHIGTKRYIAYINQFRVDGFMHMRSGFAFFRWSDAENTMHVDRLWLAERKLFAPTNGGSVLLPGGNVVLTLCSPSAPGCALACVRPNNEIAWSLSFGPPGVPTERMVGARTPNSRFPAIYRVAPKLKIPYVRTKRCVGGGCSTFEAWPIVKIAAPQYALITVFGSQEDGGCRDEAVARGSSCLSLWKQEAQFPPHWQPLEFRIDYRDFVKHYKVMVADEWGLVATVFVYANRPEKSF